MTNAATIGINRLSSMNGILMFSSNNDEIAPTNAAMALTKIIAPKKENTIANKVPSIDLRCL